MKLGLHLGDLMEVLPTFPADSFDSSVTDPPYELSFMGKKWDGTGVAFKVETWREVYRVLKPGAYLVAFGGTRTYHRMTCAIEDAGFHVRDSLAWLYGSGFPKNHDLGDGKGTALKPAFEPIVVAWKPFKGTIEKCHEQHGTAALNIDACRINPGEVVPGGGNGKANHGGMFGAETNGERPLVEAHDLGRWPANVVIDEVAAAAIDEQSGISKSGVAVGGKGSASGSNAIYMRMEKREGAGDQGYGDTGGASRFFYCAKPSREERDMGCYGMPLVPSYMVENGSKTSGLDGVSYQRTTTHRNNHPTVKPVELMRWLVKLVTPVGGIVLDPFTGSGTTGMACAYEQRQFVGVEREAEYVEIAKRRIASVAPLFAVDNE